MLHIGLAITSRDFAWVGAVYSMLCYIAAVYSKLYKYLIL